MSWSSVLATLSREGGVERSGKGGCRVAGDGRPPAVAVAAVTAVTAAALRGVKDAASGFRAGRLVPVVGVAA